MHGTHNPSLLPPPGREGKAGGERGGDHELAVMRHETPTNFGEAGARWRERLLTALNCAGDAVEIRDIAGRVLYVNHAWEQLTGHELLSVRGSEARTLEAGNPDIVRSQFARILSNVRRGRTWRGELVRRHRDGHEFIQEAIISPVIERDQAEVRYYVAVSRDVSLQREMEQQLAHLARHDNLTGLANRTLLLERIALHLRSMQHGAQRGGALLYFDFDRFKCVNDTLGHHAGDRLLRAVADRVGGRVRACDTFARMGGDEFCILLPSAADAAEATAAARRILEAFDKPFDLGGPRISTSASVGLVMLDGTEGTTPLACVCDADRAMLAAKRAGGGRIRLYDEKLSADVRARASLESSILSAIECRRLDVEYAHVQSLSTGARIGREATLSVLDLENKPFSADDALQVAEQAGLGGEVLRWLVDRVVRDHARQQAPTVRLRISHGQALYEGACELLSRAIAEHGADPSRFVVVLTDAPQRGGWQELKPALKRLSDHGVRLELHGFAESTSLRAFNGLPISSVLLDNDFVERGLADRDAARLLGGLCALAHAMDIRVGVRLRDGAPRAARRILHRAGVDFVVRGATERAFPRGITERAAMPTVPLRTSIVEEADDREESLPEEAMDAPTKPLPRSNRAPRHAPMVAESTGVRCLAGVSNRPRRRSPVRSA